MRQFSTFDVKNRLSELLDAVPAGETVEILDAASRRLVSCRSPMKRLDSYHLKRLPKWLRTHRTKIGAKAVRALIEEGRR